MKQNALWASGIVILFCFVAYIFLVKDSSQESPPQQGTPLPTVGNNAKVPPQAPMVNVNAKG